jgi:hypothetical protein
MDLFGILILGVCITKHSVNPVNIYELESIVWHRASTALSPCRSQEVFKAYRRHEKRKLDDARSSNYFGHAERGCIRV